MKIFAFDSSAKAASCAIWDGELIGEAFVNRKFPHSQTLMPMAEALLRDTRVDLAEIDVYAISAGPGSFTGLRIGMAAVKAMAYASQKPVLPISTLEGLAQNLEGFSGLICPVMDARCSQVYTALFEGRGGIPVRLREDEALEIPVLFKMLKSCREQVIFVGDGARLCYDRILEEAPEDAGRYRLAPAALCLQRAASVAAAAQRMLDGGNQGMPAGEVSPVYLRLPQAERERLKKAGAENKNTEEAV